MTAKLLSNAFEKWSVDGRPLVLASVYETEGSTYSKAGEQMLITHDGNFQGMLSGGCLEGDLATRAKDVAESGDPQLVTYDLRADDDELWGLGVGCDGMIRVFLQRLNKETNYEPFSSMRSAYEGADWQYAVTVVSSEVPGLDAGATIVMHNENIVWTNVDEKYRDQILSTADQATANRQSQSLSVEIDGQSCDLLISILRPYPSVLVLGAGMDAIPMVRLIAELGWRATVSDHRPAYLENGDFSQADRIACIVASDIDKELDLARFDAAIVMSHHLVTDETYLRKLAASPVSYVGLLGPPHRRERLLVKLGDQRKQLEGRLHGPAGIDINASGAASIALSIVAQMHRQIIPGR
jgi:xanthine/CO dehydrogenase XdhC/CoxF family maturation factor